MEVTIYALTLSKQRLIGTMRARLLTLKSIKAISIIIVCTARMSSGGYSITEVGMKITTDDKDAVVVLNINTAWIVADNPKFVYVQHYTADIFLASLTMPGEARAVGDVRFSIYDVSGWRDFEEVPSSELFALADGAEAIYRGISSVDKRQAIVTRYAMENWADNVIVIDRLYIEQGYRHLSMAEDVVHEIGQKMGRNFQIIVADPKRQGLKVSDVYASLFLPLELTDDNDPEMERNLRTALKANRFKQLAGTSVFYRMSDFLALKVRDDGKVALK